MRRRTPNTLPHNLLALAELQLIAKTLGELVVSNVVTAQISMHRKSRIAGLGRTLIRVN